MPDCPRRRVVFGLGAVTATGLAGCAAVSTPDPEVVETEQVLAEDDPRDITVRVRVENTGDSGRVRVTVRTYDGDGDELEFFGRVVDIESGERQWLEFDITLATNPERVEATAEVA